MSEITLLGVGDVGTNRENPESMFKNVKQMISGADISFCQLEPVLTDRGVPLPQARLTCSSTPSAAAAFRDAGFDVVSFATNHCMDWGRDGFFDTLEVLEKSGLRQVGAGANIDEARRPVIFDVNGTRVAFLAYCSILPQDYWATDRRPGCTPLRGFTVYEQVEHDQPGTPCRIHSYPHRDDMAAMIEDIKNAKQEADIVIMSAHWGIHFKEAEIAEYQRDYAHAAIDNGADLILGHHAHILKPIEVYRGKVIFYSLGNFGMEEISSMKRDLAAYGGDHKSSKAFKEMKNIAPKWKDSNRSFPPDSYKSMIAKCIIKDKKIWSVSFIPVDIPEDCCPVIVTEEEPKFSEILEYMEKITSAENLLTEYSATDGEVFINFL